MRCSIPLAERPHIVPIRASFTSSVTIRGEEQQFLIREEQMPVVGKGPEIDKSALIIVDMQNDFLHRDGNFSQIAKEHPEANIDMPFLIGTGRGTFIEPSDPPERCSSFLRGRVR